MSAASRRRQGVERPIRLASNESALGPSPKAVAAYRALAGEIHRYPDGSAIELREALGRVHDLDPARIVCGSGSDELIGMLLRAYAGPGTEVLYSRHGFLMYPIGALSVGATPVAAPERDLTADVDALLERVTERTRIVFIANPNNPTGTYLPISEMRRLHAGLPPHVVLAIDAAYAEFVNRNDFEPGVVAGRPGRKRRDAAHLLENLRAGRAAARLGVLPAGDRRCAEPHPRPVQRDRAGAGGRDRGGRGHRGAAPRPGA